MGPTADRDLRPARRRHNDLTGGRAARIDRDRAGGLALGVRGTPTFFVNEQQVRELSYGALNFRA